MCLWWSSPRWNFILCLTSGTLGNPPLPVWDVYYFMFTLQYFLLHAFWRRCSSCWLTWNGLLWTYSLFMHSLWCIIFPSPVVCMLAAIKRGCFIIHMMIDVPPVVVFMLESHPIVLRQESTGLPTTAVEIKMLSVALSCLLAENPLKPL